MGQAMHDYREWATHCHRMAAKAPTEALKASWLQLAAIWLQMATNQEWRGREKKFHAVPQAEISRPRSPQSQ